MAEQPKQRLRFKLEEKRAIYDKSLATPGITLAQLGQWAQRELGLLRPVGVSTVAFVLKQQKELKQQQQQQERETQPPVASRSEYNQYNNDGDHDDSDDASGEEERTPRERSTAARPLNRARSPLPPLPGSRIHMTLLQKEQVFEKFEATPDMKFRDLAKWAAEQFGLDKPPARSTLSHIIKRQRLEPTDSELRNPDMKRKTAFRSAFVRVESDLMKWLEATAELGASLANSQIRAYASALRDELVERETDPQAREKLEALQFSNDWLSKFQLQYGLIEPRARKQTN